MYWFDGLSQAPHPYQLICLFCFVAKGTRPTALVPSLSKRVFRGIDYEPHRSPQLPMSSTFRTLSMI